MKVFNKVVMTNICPIGQNQNIFFGTRHFMLYLCKNLMNTIGSRSLITFSYHIVMRIMSIWFGELACLYQCR